MIATHGAGVDGTSSFWTGNKQMNHLCDEIKGAFNQPTEAWILFPTGRRPWGYDWHGEFEVAPSM